MAAKGKIRNLGPNVIRFPGIRGFNRQYWKDGTGFNTTKALFDSLPPADLKRCHRWVEQQNAYQEAHDLPPRSQHWGDDSAA
jgi:hypothetical protein